MPEFKQGKSTHALGGWFIRRETYKYLQQSGERISVKDVKLAEGV